MGILFENFIEKVIFHLLFLEIILVRSWCSKNKFFAYKEYIKTSWYCVKVALTAISCSLYITCYLTLAICRMLFVTCYMPVAICYLLSITFYLKLGISCKNSFPFACCCLSLCTPFYNENLGFICYWWTNSRDQIPLHTMTNRTGTVCILWRKSIEQERVALQERKEAIFFQEIASLR